MIINNYIDVIKDFQRCTWFVFNLLIRWPKYNFDIKYKLSNSTLSLSSSVNNLPAAHHSVFSAVSPSLQSAGPWLGTSYLWMSSDCAVAFEPPSL